MKKIVSILAAAIAGGAAGVGVTGWNMMKAVETQREASSKHLRLFKMMNRWVEVKQEGKNLSDYFVKNGYRKIAVYGMHYAGERLVEELADSDIEIICGIDRNIKDSDTIIDVITIEDKIPEVDAVVVTAITFFDEIEQQLSGKAACPVISLEDILYDV